MTPIIFDLDDTGLKTHPWLIQHLKETHGDDLPIDQYLTKDNGGTGFLGLMESGLFLDKVEFQDNFITFVETVIEFGYPVGICSHRGYHPMGQILTRKLFTQQQWDMFTYRFFLDPIVTPDKLEFLHDVIDEPFILFDDRPHFKSEYNIEDADNIILFDQPWNKNLPFERAFGFDQHALSIILRRNLLLEES